MWLSKTLVVIAVMCSMSVVVHSSQAVMKDMTKNFIKAYEVCAKEYNLPEAAGAEVMNFWKEGYVLTSREAGCAILCLSSKLNLLDPEGTLHRGNTVELGKQHGSDDAMAHQLVDIVHACEKSVPPNEDNCLMALGISMCFKTEIHKLNWAPDHELLLEEMMAEMKQ
uniref:Pheromone binding protein-A n=1 Tax=Ostrinia furnacalis TaxID=93504 RepID=A0A2Z5UWT4_OSTFU|nr:pheromone binding protein-A [Ostrinia furnacalis]